MKALIYADGCYALRRVRQYLLVTLVIALLPVFLGVSKGSEPLDAPAALQMMVGIVALYVLLFFTLSACFQSDEAGGWERARLALPVTRREVVLARYLFILLALCVGSVAIALLGLASMQLWPLVLPALSGAFNLEEMLAGSIAAESAFLALASLQMPCLFMWGVRRGSLALSIPALLPLASMVIPEELNNAVTQLVLSWVGLWGPWPVLLAGALAALLMYVLSALLSCVIYERREL